LSKRYRVEFANVSVYLGGLHKFEEVLIRRLGKLNSRDAAEAEAAEKHRMPFVLEGLTNTHNK